MNKEASIETLRAWVHAANHLVVLSGAGISTESGIPDFRSPAGIWKDEGLMDAMSDAWLNRHPEDFWAKYKYAFLNDVVLESEPNPAHLALALLEEAGRPVTIFTQNVDGLHQAAGSRRVYELHGNVRYAVCPNCQTRYGLDYLSSEPVPTCRRFGIKGDECHHVLAPDTVLFGQEVRHFQTAALTMMSADLVLIVGSSLTVDPVAELPAWTKKGGGKLAIVNLEPTDCDAMADIVIHEKAGTVLPQLV